MYKFCAPRFHRGILAIKGVGGSGRPIVSHPTKNKKTGCLVFPLGVDTLKKRLYARLTIKKPGPGFHHFNMDWEIEDFEELVSERCVIKVDKTSGHGKPVWVKKPGRSKNERLDCRNYAMAAFEIYAPNLARIAAKRRPQIKNAKQLTPAQEVTAERRAEKRKPRRRPGNNNFATRFKR